MCAPRINDFAAIHARILTRGSNNKHIASSLEMDMATEEPRESGGREGEKVEEERRSGGREGKGGEKDEDRIIIIIIWWTFYQCGYM